MFDQKTEPYIARHFRQKAYHMRRREEIAFRASDEISQETIYIHFIRQ